MKYFDFHSHKLGQFNCFNCDYKLVNELRLLDYIQPISLSSHPWSREKFNINDFIKAYEIVQKRSDLKLIAIGEIGIDRVRGHNIDEQVKQFRELSLFAKRVDLPMIIHCVKSLEDILKILQEIRFNKPCMFHDFNGNLKMAMRVVEKGHFIGIGQSLFRENSRVYKNIPLISLEHILPETDDMGKEISDVYKTLSKLLGMSETILAQKIFENRSKIFELL